MTVKNFATNLGLETTGVVGASIRPSLLLDFARSKTVDPRITFTRNSSATYTNQYGTIVSGTVNAPRIEYNTTGQCKGLLIEESRTNLYKNSGDFYSSLSYVFWDNTLGFRQTSLGTTTSTNYALSVYFKVNSCNQQAYAIGIGDNTSVGVKFNTLTTGTWVKVSHITTQGVSGDLVDLRIQTPDINLGTSFSGAAGSTVPMTRNYGLAPDGSTGSTRIYYTGTSAIVMDVEVWGYQVEAGSFPTSYIPTTTAAVTRAADIAVMTGTNFSSWYNQSEGTVYSESSSLSTLTSVQSIALFKYPNLWRLWRIDAGTASSLVFWYGSQAELYVGGTYNNIGAVSLIQNKLAIALSSTPGQAAFSLNGAAAVARSGILGSSATQLGVGTDGTNNPNSFLNGHIARIAYYPKRLSNAELQVLTE